MSRFFTAFFHAHENALRLFELATTSKGCVVAYFVQVKSDGSEILGSVHLGSGRRQLARKTRKPENNQMDPDAYLCGVTII